MKRLSALTRAVLVTLGVALAAGCHRTSTTATRNTAVDGALARAGGGVASGNGEGYLGMVSRNYQVVPGHECNDGTTRRLAYAASLYQDLDGQMRLSGDACSNESVVISPQEIVPVDPAEGVVSVRGGLFVRRAEAPVPAAKDQYRQLSCSWKANGVIYNARINSDMSGTRQLLEIHKTWTEPGATLRSSAWIQKWIRTTTEYVGTHVIFRGETADVLIDANFAVRGYKGKFLTHFHYSGTEQIDAEVYCFVNNRELKQ